MQYEQPCKSLNKQGKWEEAEEMYRLKNQTKWRQIEEMRAAALEAGRGVLGQEHRERLLLEDICKFAKISHEQGMWQEAEETYREVLDVQRRVLGHSHPDTLKGMAKLANALPHHGKAQETGEMHRDVLEGCAEWLASNTRTHFAASATLQIKCPREARQVAMHLLSFFPACLA